MDSEYYYLIDTIGNEIKDYRSEVKILEREITRLNLESDSLRRSDDDDATYKTLISSTKISALTIKLEVYQKVICDISRTDESFSDKEFYPEG